MQRIVRNVFLVQEFCSNTFDCFNTVSYFGRTLTEGFHCVRLSAGASSLADCTSGIFYVAFDVLLSAKETDHLTDPLLTQYSDDDHDSAESQNDGGIKSPSSLTGSPSSESLPKEKSG